MYFSTQYHPFFNKTNIVNFLHINYSEIQRMFTLRDRCIVQLLNGRSQGDLRSSTHSITFTDLIPVMMRARHSRIKDLIIKPHVHKGNYGIYYVHNHYKNTEYQVAIKGDNHRCTCEDFKGMNSYIDTSPKLPCKHILATREFIKNYDSLLKVK